MLEKSLAIPIMGFEVEEKRHERKNIRGDIDSLNSLSPQLRIIVLSDRIKTVTIYNSEEKKIFPNFP